MDIKKNDKTIVIRNHLAYIHMSNQFSTTGSRRYIDWPIYYYFVHFPNLVEYNLKHSLSESQVCTWPVLLCYGVPCSIYSFLHCIWSLQGVLTMGHVTPSLSLEHQGFGHFGVPWLGHTGLRSHRSSVVVVWFEYTKDPATWQFHCCKATTHHVFHKASLLYLLLLPTLFRTKG